MLHTHTLICYTLFSHRIHQIDRKRYCRPSRAYRDLIRSTLRNHKKHGMSLTYGTNLTIRTDAGSEYKHSLHEFYTSLGFHPAGIQVDTRRYDDKERIIYIYGLTWKDNDGNDRSWTELFTQEEKERYSKALD